MDLFATLITIRVIRENREQISLLICAVAHTESFATHLRISWWLGCIRAGVLTLSPQSLLGGGVC